MKRYTTAIIALIVGALCIGGAAGVASARGGHGFHGGGPGQWGCGPGQGVSISPEARGILEKSHAQIAPLHMEWRAKQAELTAKIYSGADDKTIQDLTRAVNDLQARLNDSHVKLQQQLAKAGVPLGAGMGACPGMGGGMGFHGMKRGTGFYGQQYGPCYGYAQPDAPAGGAGNVGNAE